MTLSDFIQNCDVFENENCIDWSVIIILLNGEKCTLTIYECKTEYEAKERAYLYLTNLIETKNKKNERKRINIKTK